jgi:hypothetical protein
MKRLRMSRAPILLDFKSRPRGGGILGLIVLSLGGAGAVFAGMQFRASSHTLSGLELRLDAIESAHKAGMGSVAAGTVEEAGPVVAELSAPWSLLLQELEAASQEVGGSIAVLAVEPDREKGRIRIVAEARDLPTALAYIERLQKSHALRFPMLDSHEVRTEDHAQPVRFQLSAEWMKSS